VQAIFEMAHKDHFAHVKHQQTQTVNKGHGRLEIRNHWIIDDESQGGRTPSSGGCTKDPLS
jgi:hypothetical protein